MAKIRWYCPRCGAQGAVAPAETMTVAKLSVLKVNLDHYKQDQACNNPARGMYYTGPEHAVFCLQISACEDDCA